ncbi:hypothetical protein [Frankia sp. Cj3]|uniref:hypothetical protein n=1 Tax=Frankia sp. Cj3 TaxID=2880976 RepID=UPI0035B131D0
MDRYREFEPLWDQFSALLPPRPQFERTHSWMNNYVKLRRCTDRNGEIVGFYLYPAATFVTVRCLIQKARRRTAGTVGPPPAA